MARNIEISLRTLGNAKANKHGPGQKAGGFVVCVAYATEFNLEFEKFVGKPQPLFFASPRWIQPIRGGGRNQAGSRRHDYARRMRISSLTDSGHDSNTASPIRRAIRRCHYCGENLPYFRRLRPLGAGLLQ